MTTGHALKRGTLRFFIMILSNFVAIDFETMTGALTSACAVGLVKVREGVIIEEYYTLIHPIPDTFERTNTGINGIDGNGGVGGFTPEEAEQFRGALYDVAERIRRVADNL